MTESTADATTEDAVRSYELVMVAYRSAPLVDELLRSLGPSFPAVVVDNFHGADGLEELLRARPNTRYIDGPGTGFAAGANVAVADSRHDVVVVVSPDSMPTAEQLDSLVADVRDDPSVAQSSAVTLTADGRVELGIAGWEPTWWRALVHATGLHYLVNRAGMWARPTAFKDVDVDWCGGCVSAISRPILLQLGAFDDSFFVYNEDVDLSRRLRQHGFRELLRTDVLVPHRIGSSGDAPLRMSRFRGSSMMIDVRRHHGTIETVAIRVILAIGSGVRALAYRTLRRPGPARGHEAYIKGLWFGPPPPSG